MIYVSRDSRKMEHIKLALQQEFENRSPFHDIHLLHNPISELNYEEISLGSKMGGLSTSSPIFINAMTGGAIDALKINQQLAIAAKELGLPLAVGSQMAAIKNPELSRTFSIVRKENPDGIVIANLGQEATLDQARQAIDMIDANVLQIHLNIMQELIMPEGDRNFSGMLKRISTLVDHIHIPLIIKEVGFGMPQEAVLALRDIGVNIIDIGGRGGTNFAKIENERGANRYTFLNDWGLTTPISLLEARSVEGLQLIGSGGINNGLNIVKALALGASLVGMAGPILKAVYLHGVEGVVELLRDIHHQIRMVMVAIGAKDVSSIRELPIVVMGETKEWCELRGINIKGLAHKFNPSKP